MENCVLQYAIVKKLGNTPHLGRSDIAIDEQGEFHQVIQAEANHTLLSPHLVKRYSVTRVQQILDTKDGELRWKVLN